MGSNYREYAPHWYEMINHFFGSQDPLTIVPPLEECPNCKVNEFYNWMQCIGTEAWEKGPTVQAAEQSCSMQGY